uniref:Peroxidasin n=3 Tax=Drosophila melanogaster TaxID=7227 RepID=PXDN_DROME|nr:peroxidasin, isoform A [Drosophila melanogaster]NP_995975.1 peroxidasin, isoform E [Drosophila melanogaster]NP_995976.1 peroxidasin, isoform D [Drosophila melanogaster]NP_995977.1 peroxidasin, isoform C [Drosophila melanogaster]Q9VZZ4.1 RecName: Full=Peroxidasin; Flags: Precursor [Drosophila melanogaster]AOQ10577.1 Pxn-RA [synthetic construct]AAF47668.1 peroxidasin, isoform A [Drosophila melanogaster]AAS64946.1 peroxidasin, isoform C [Drosophila melanogaster]AAS64947.1 peroxidasin, isofo|eukprot:NP_523891.2 peroxidasin, isoform A [Drosophila melanogaster]
MRFMLLMLQLLGLLLLLAGGVQSVYCPAGCTCLERTVRCIRAKLSAVPKLPQDTQTLDLRFNHIEELPANAFSGLAQLTTLFLNDNELAYLQDGALNGLTALRFVYLNNNRLSRLPATIFQRMPRLEAIFLENNDIWQLPAGLFDNLPRLNRLIMYNNKLTQLPVDGFNRLNNLKRLRLDGNAIDCNCGVYSLWRRWHLDVQRQLVSISLTCAAPQMLQNQGFSSLGEHHFKCAKPQFLVAPQDAQVAAGEQVELSCEVTGLPRPQITWMHNTQELGLEEQAQAEILPSGSLLIRSADTSDMGIYQCIARNEMGALRSQPVRLVVNGGNHPLDSPIDARSNQVWADAGTPMHGATPLPSPLPSPPHFTHQPHDQIVALHGSGHVLLDCAASGWPQPDIQWFVNGRQLLQSTPSLQLQANGSLILLQPNQLSAGTYRCEARNSLGSVQATARIELKELPEILTAPQSQTIKLGKAFVLECDADGNPLPTIDWQLNGVPLPGNTPDLQLENENTELVVGAARQEHAGVYRCTAHNENGETSVEATIKVERSQSPPQLAIEPSNLVAITGTTIELPCQADQPEDGLQISWRHDGRLIDPNVQLAEKYQISGAGSLFVKNVTIPDGGRYECQLKNQFGRASASALVTIRNNVDLAPGDRYVRIAFAEAAKEIDLAINNTLDMLFSNRSDKAPPNYGELLRVFRFPTGEARQLARAAEIYERTLVNIRKHVQEGDNLTMKSEEYEFRDLLSREHLHLVAELSGCMEHREMPNCTDMCFHSRYRSIDGTCNNLQHPTWGASLTAFRRLAPPIYENGFSMPVGWTKGMLYSGHAKPSARLVSTSLVATKEITPDARITHMVMQWGQFLDHDLDHAIPSVSSESWDGIDCKKSCEMAPPCYPIEVPPNDPRVRNRRCIDVVRSSAICGSGMTSLFFDSVQHREQINQLTSYIDASQVYGYSTAFAQELRNLTSQEGLLRVGVHFPRQKDMLPFAAPQDGMDCRRNLDENTMSCFVSGDIRVNEQVGLLAMHTIWMREHNRIASKLKQINSHWDGDTLYQEARKIVGAQMQHITFKQWLPLIIGESGMEMMGEYQGYNPQLNPSIANEFATAALRFGHTIINPILHRLNETFQPIPQGHLLLHKAFFAPWRLAYEGGVDPLMRGFLAVPAKLKTPDQNLNTELTEKLFQTAHAVALDLAAINIQRGRDHGMPGYNVYRKLCNLTVAQDFEDLAGEISSAEIRQKMKELYGHPDNVDVWLGGILEDQVEGGKVGPLFQCLLVEQFRRLRDGDRLYYENPGVFSPEQLTQIKQANFGRVLCDVGDNFDQVTENVFILAKHQGGYKKCEDIIGINLYLWQECGRCNSPPAIFDSYIPQTYTKRSNRQKRDLGKENDEVATAESYDSPLESLYDVNEERVSGLEELIGSFQKELKKLHKKLRKLEDSCNSADSEPVAQVVQLAAAPPQLVSKPKRSHCVDDKGTTRLNNEVWSPDVCTKCNCFHGQVNCLRERCGEVSCPPGVDPLTPPEACCPHCPMVK